MAASNSGPQYPLLEAILAIRNLPLTSMFTVRTLAELFGVSVRAIQHWMASGKLKPRSLPGRWKFTAQDIEDFLQASPKAGC
jgi:hypothetical protein